jgi:hypothetical protein
MAKAHKDYSGTPLPRKLGIREGSRVLVVNPPEGFALGPLPAEVDLLARASTGMDVVVLFATNASDLTAGFGKFVPRMDPAGRIWICWPKKAARLSTDVTFEVAHSIGLDAGLVDNKSASITDAFQGLQFVLRLKDRPR